MKKQIEKKMKKEKDERKDCKTEPGHTWTEWVPCSDDWRDLVITYVPELNNIPIEDNYADISMQEIKKAFKQNKRRAQMKRAK